MKGTHDYLHEVNGQELELIIDYSYTAEVKPRFNCEPSEDDAPYGPEVDILSVSLDGERYYFDDGLEELIVTDILENI